MAQYVDKDALLLEIEKLKETYSKCPTHSDYEDGLKTGRLIGYKDATNKLNSLKAKEVDLEAEIKMFQRQYQTIDEYEDYPATIYAGGIEYIARHFFELGLRISQPTTSVYGIEEALKENGIDPDSKEADMYREAIYKIYDRLKAQKGE